MKPSVAAEQVARQLHIVLNAGRAADLETIAKTPEGDLNDGLPANGERVGTVQTHTDTLEILLERRQRNGGPPVWLFSNETLSNVPDVAGQVEAESIDRFVPQALRIRIFSLPLYRWLVTLLGVAVALAFAYLGTKLLVPLLSPLIRRMTGEPDDRHLATLLAPLRVIVLAAGFGALAIVSATVLGRRFWIVSAKAIAVFGVAWLAVRFSDIVAERASRHLTRRQRAGRVAVLTLSHRLFKIGVTAVAIVVLVYAAGGDITAVMAGVGLGGIAIALAAQKTLENLFGGVSVISDEPIRVGDFCRFADRMGTVEDIGLRSTRIRTLERTVLTIPNGQLSLMTLENFDLRDRFLFNHKIGLRYETTPEQLRGILAGIREMFRTHPVADPEDARIRLVQFADSAFLIEVFVYLLGDQYLEFLETQEELLLAIMDIIVAGGSGFAYPSQTLYLTRDKSGDTSRWKEASER
ncbi:MAG: mechanosensitive ion channel family protein [Candidatus Solibacter sp.]